MFVVVLVSVTVLVLGTVVAIVTVVIVWVVFVVRLEVPVTLTRPEAMLGGAAEREVAPDARRRDMDMRNTARLPFKLVPS